MKAVAATLGVSRSNLHERLNGSAKPRRGYHKAQDAAILPRIESLVAKRPTYGYRRITSVLNRELRTDGFAPVNHKRVYRIMKNNGLLLERSGFDRPERIHDGKVIMMRSNLRPLPADLPCKSPAGQRVFGRVGVHLLERRCHSCCVPDRRPRPRNHLMARCGQCRDQRLGCA